MGPVSDSFVARAGFVSLAAKSPARIVVSLSRQMHFTRLVLPAPTGPARSFKLAGAVAVFSQAASFGKGANPLGAQARVAVDPAHCRHRVMLWFRFLFTGEAAGGRPGSRRDAGRHLTGHRLSAASRRFSSGWPMSRALWRSGGAPKPSQCLLEKPRVTSRRRRVS